MTNDKTGSVLDYMRWRGDLRFSRDPFNAVDALVLAMLSYLPLKGIAPGGDSRKKISLEETAQRYFSEHPSHAEHPEDIGLTVSPSMDAGLMQLMQLASKSARFSRVKVSRFTEKTDLDAEEQFSAVTFSLPDGKREKVIAFRGTGNTLIGWKEDFAMAYREEIPAQESACEYLNHSVGMFSGKATVCGHSKGGNLAVYAAACLNRMKLSKLSRVINFDGPGFNFSLQPRSNFSECESKVVNYVPEESVVGMLLDAVGERSVISSTARYLYQHNPLTWAIMRAGFVDGSLSQTTQLLEENLESWLEAISLEKREAFIDALFDILGASEGKTISPKESLKNINGVIKNIKDLDADTKQILAEVFSSMTEKAKEALSETLKEKLSIDA